MLGGAAVIVAAVALRVAVSGVGWLVTAQHEMGERGALLVRAEQEVAMASSLSDSAAALARALVRLAPALLNGNGSAEAMVDLSGRLTLAAALSRSRLARVEPAPDSAVAGRLRRVGARAALEGDISGLARFLEAVEAGESLLVVSDLRIDAANPFGPVRNAEVLRWEVTVGGWYLAGR